MREEALSMGVLLSLRQMWPPHHPSCRPVSFSPLSLIIPPCIYPHDTFFADQMEAGDCQTRPRLPTPRDRRWVLRDAKPKRILATVDAMETREGAKRSSGRTRQRWWIAPAQIGTKWHTPLLPPLHFHPSPPFRRSLNTSWGWLLPLWAYEGGFPSHCSNMIGIYLD